MKKIISLIICLSMIASLTQSLLFGSYAAETGSCGENLTWSFDPSDGVLTISGSGDMYDYASASSVPWYAFRNDITGISVTSDIESVYDYAFSYLSRISYNVYDGANYIGNENDPYVVFVSLVNETAESCEIKEGTKIISSFAFGDYVRLKNLVIPESIVSIGSLAFANCSKLTGMSFSENLKKIGSRAFSNCTRLETVHLPSTMTSIGSRAFYNCRALESINIPEGVEILPEGLFAGCSSLMSISIPASVTSIQTGAFDGCSSFADVYYGGSVQSWSAIAKAQDVEAFLGGVTVHFNSVCGNDLVWNFYPEYGKLVISGVGDMFDYSVSDPAPWNGIKELITSIEISADVTSIGSYAFANSDRLEKVLLQENVASIGDGAFSGCCALTDVNYTGDINSWQTIRIGTDNDPLFAASLNFSETGVCGENISWIYDKGTKSLTVTGTGEMNDYGASDAPWYGFRDEMESVYVSDGVTYIGAYAFCGMSSVTQVSLPDTVTEIGMYSFSGISSPAFGEYGNAKYLGCRGNPHHILMSCDESASSCAIHPDTAVISYWAFNDSRVKNVTIPNGVKTISEGAFANAARITSINIPASVTKICGNVFVSCKNLAAITVDAQNEVYRSVNNCIIEIASGKVISGCKTSVIPDDGSVTTIGEEAFFGCTDLTGVTIPQGITSIEKNAFNNCSSLPSITLPDSVTSIGESAFSGCKLIEEITVPEGVASLERYVLSNCTALEEIRVPASVRTVAPYAFSGCSSLERVYYSGSETDFGNISVDNTGGGNYRFLNATIYYVSFLNGSCGDTLFWEFDPVLGALIITGDGAMSTFASSDDVPWKDLKEMIRSVYLPNGISFVSEYAFGNCALLADIYYAGTAEEWQNVSVAPGSALDISEITIHFNDICGDGVTWSFDEESGKLTLAGSGALYDYSAGAEAPWHQFRADITSVGIPDGILYVGTYAFDSCVALTDVYYGGDSSSWQALSEASGEGNDPLFNAAVTYTYTVVYDANGGESAPAPQTEAIGSSAVVTSEGAVKKYTVYLHANGGELPYSSIEVHCTFNNWNTSCDGNGTVYNAGDVYEADEDLTLYAQWTDPSVGSLPVISQGARVFDGWYTDPIGGEAVRSDYTLTGNINIYAHWRYYLDTSEIYSFANSRTNFGSTYFVDDEDFLKLCDYVRTVYRDNEKTANSVINNLQKSRSSAWGGSCYGMAVTTLLDRNGQIGFNENFDPAASTMSEVAAPVQNVAVENAINYYHISQSIPYLRSTNSTKIRKEKAGWREGLTELIETAKKGVPLLFCYTHGKSAHAIVIKGYTEGEDGSHKLIAYDNRYPAKDTVVAIDKNLYSCMVNGREDCLSIEFIEDMSGFDVIDIDGPENDYSNYSFSFEGGGQQTTPEEDTAEITVKCGGRVTVVNAEGQTMTFENGEYYGSMEIGGEYFSIVGDGEEEEETFTFTYTVANSASFKFIPESDELYVSVLSADIFASSETVGAEYVLITKDDGVTAHGTSISYTLSLSVNNGICDMVSIAGSTNTDVKLTNIGGELLATGVDTNSGSVSVYYNTVSSDVYNYRPGYSHFKVVAVSDAPGDVMIMGSSADNDVYDVNIGIPYDPCEHVWDEGVVTVAPTYETEGVKTYTCTKCGETMTEIIPPLDPKPGDVNGDGKINSRDLALFKRYIADSDSAGAVAVNCDINGDGKINSRDIAQLKRMFTSN